MNYLFKPKDLATLKTPAELGCEYTYVRRLELNGEKKWEAGEKEWCFVIISGQARFACNGVEGTAVLKDMVYQPRNTTMLLDSGDAVVMAFGCPSDRDARCVHVKFTDVDSNPGTHKQFGREETNCRRDVWNFIDADFNCSRLMMGLCRGRTGGWTSWPPHEHAEKREEVYAYFDMGTAFGIQCVYDDMDAPYAVAMVREGDLMSVPRGFHPNCGTPAGPIHFIYCMVSKTAGDRNFMDLNIQELYGDKFE